MSHRLNARLDDDLARKLETLRNLTEQTTTEVVRAALELYYDTVRRGGADAYRQLEEAGFIGCAEGPEDLSESYKESLSDSLAAKT